jgi:hypothetical protein
MLMSKKILVYNFRPVKVLPLFFSLTHHRLATSSDSPCCFSSCVKRPNSTSPVRFSCMRNEDRWYTREKPARPLPVSAWSHYNVR